MKDILNRAVNIFTIFWIAYNFLEISANYKNGNDIINWYIVTFGVVSAFLPVLIINYILNKKIRLDSWDKYGGRVLGDVIIDGQSLSDLLIESNFAKSYQGGKKISWCY